MYSVSIFFQLLWHKIKAAKEEIFITALNKTHKHLM